MQTSETPPSRKSIFARGELKPVGPHQRLTSFGSTQAFQTAASGASNTRVLTTLCFGVRFELASLMRIPFNRLAGNEPTGYIGDGAGYGASPIRGQKSGCICDPRQGRRSSQ